MSQRRGNKTAFFQKPNLSAVFSRRGRTARYVCDNPKGSRPGAPPGQTAQPRAAPRGVPQARSEPRARRASHTRSPSSLRTPLGASLTQPLIRHGRLPPQPAGHVPLQGHDFAGHAGHVAAPLPLCRPRPPAAPGRGEPAARPGPGEGRGAAGRGLALPRPAPLRSGPARPPLAVGPAHRWHRAGGGEARPA